MYPFDLPMSLWNTLYDTYFAQINYYYQLYFIG